MPWGCFRLFSDLPHPLLKASIGLVHINDINGKANLDWRKS